MCSAISGCSGRVTLTCKAPSDILAPCRRHIPPCTELGKQVSIGDIHVHCTQTGLVNLPVLNLQPDCIEGLSVGHPQQRSLDHVVTVDLQLP